MYVCVWGGTVTDRTVDWIGAINSNEITVHMQKYYASRSIRLSRMINARKSISHTTLYSVFLNDCTHTNGGAQFDRHTITSTLTQRTAIVSPITIQWHSRIQTVTPTHFSFISYIVLEFHLECSYDYTDYTINLWNDHKKCRILNFHAIKFTKI